MPLALELRQLVVDTEANTMLEMWNMDNSKYCCVCGFSFSFVVLKLFEFFFNFWDLTPQVLQSALAVPFQTDPASWATESRGLRVTGLPLNTAAKQAFSSGKI